jgi:predicted ribosome quality control (RQC) complex YloA/Tae2 family protein
LLLTYYTLRALVGEWDALLAGARLADAYSQHRDELSLAFEGPGQDEASTLAVLVRSDMRLLFRNRGHGRAKRNTASLFEEALGRRVESVRVAERDRIVVVDLDGGLFVQMVLFGPRPNAWLVERTSGQTLDAFVASGEREGESPPEPRPAPAVTSLEDFVSRWPTKGSLDRAVARTMPLFDATLAAEVVHLAGVSVENAAECNEADLRKLFAASRTLEDRLAEPDPLIYWRGARAELFALIPLAHVDGSLRPEPFANVDDAVRIFSHRALGQERFDARYRPLEQRLARTAARLARRSSGMLEEIGRASRADTYEKFGHLLMAQAAGLPAGQEEVVLPDILSDGEPVPIPMDPALTGIENAQRFYDRARRTRASRAHAEARWEEAERRAAEANSLLATLRACETLDAVQTYEREHEAPLANLIGAASGEEDRQPFRRFPLPGGFEAWVGKNARSNAELITRHARPHDLWLHARGVPGSHVIVRRASRDAPVPKQTVEAAARLAAHYSQARTSALVPVQVAERKHVRPVKGGPAGAVRVEREEVLLVEPATPSS